MVEIEKCEEPIDINQSFSATFTKEIRQYDTLDYLENDKRLSLLKVISEKEIDESDNMYTSSTHKRKEFTVLVSITSQVSINGLIDACNEQYY